MSKYQVSLDALRTMLEKNPNTTEKEWNIYAKKNNLFSSFTMQAHRDVYNWEQLKKSLNGRDKKLNKKIENTRKKLQIAINKYGLTSQESILLNNEMKELTIIYNKNEEYKYIKSGRIYTRRKYNVWNIYEFIYGARKNGQKIKKVSSSKTME